MTRTQTTTPTPMRSARPIILAVLAVLLFALVAGCGKKRAQDAADGAADCQAVGKKLVELSEATLATLDIEHKKVVQAQIPLARDRFVKTCQEANWPAEVRACFVSAQDTAGFDACAQNLAQKGTTPGN